MAALLSLIAACSSPGQVSLPAPGAADDSAPAYDSGEPPGPPDASSEAAGSPLLRFDPTPDLMESAFSLNIYSSVKSGQIVYTLDGSDPRTSAAALRYAGPLDVQASLVLRAALLRDGEWLGPVATGTWIFPDQVAAQVAPDGWPDTWFAEDGGGVYPAHYGLEPDVVGDDPAALVAAIRALPALCLALDPADLWGERGLYDHAWEEGADWERPVNVSMINTDSPWGADAGLRMYGGASRSPSGSPKKTFRVIFRADYGPASLEETLYGERPDQVNSFILRGGYNHTWTHWDPEQRGRAQYLRDRFARESQRATGWAASRGRAVHLFLDGLYWGVYDVAERADAHFFAQRYGEQDGATDPEAWDVLNSGEVIDGTDEAWREALALAAADDGSDAALARLQAVVDPDALIDYMLMNFWVGNTDWPYHNWYAGRARDGGRWRFVSWDAEHILEDLGDDVTGALDTGTPAELWQALLRHDAFVEQVSVRAQALLAEGGPFSAEQAGLRMEELDDELLPALLGESARWGDYRRDVSCYASPPCPLYTVEEHWLPERDRLRDELLPERSAVFRRQLASRGWIDPD